MDVVIIAQNVIFQAALQKALTPLGLNVHTYDYDARIPESIPQIAICIVSDNTELEALKIAQQHEAFAILTSNTSFDNKLAEDFLNVLKAPIRLGRLVNAISGYINHRAQRDKLQLILMGEFILDPRSNEFKKPEGNQRVKLTEKEQDILLYLYESEKKIISRQEMLNHVWGYVDGVETHTLETHIYRLRQKIETDPANPTFLVTKEEGYSLSF